MNYNSRANAETGMEESNWRIVLGILRGCVRIVVARLDLLIARFWRWVFGG